MLVGPTAARRPGALTAEEQEAIQTAAERAHLGLDDLDDGEEEGAAA